jgi:hypothetical protein
MPPRRAPVNLAVVVGAAATRIEFVFTKRVARRRKNFRALPENSSCASESYAYHSHQELTAT